MKTTTTGKKIILSFILLLMVSLSYGQKNWGIGVKLGDPLGLSVKKYSGNKALELVIGRSYYWGGYNYDYYYTHDNRFKNKAGYYYINSYGYTTPIAIQLRYLVHKDIKGIDGLQWYAGIGGQFRYQRFFYDYWEAGYGTRTERVTDYGIGPDFIFGVEYTFDGVPISLAADVNLYMEIIDRPFLLLFQGGLAARYNF